MLSRILVTRLFGAAPIAAHVSQAAAKESALSMAGASTALVSRSSGEAPGPLSISHQPGQKLARAVRLGLVSREDAVAAIRRSIYVSHLDPDLAANRSFSIETKFRMQRDRTASRHFLAEEEQALDMWRLVQKLGLS